MKNGGAAPGILQPARSDGTSRQDVAGDAEGGHSGPWRHAKRFLKRTIYTCQHTSTYISTSGVCVHVVYTYVYTHIHMSACRAIY